MENTAADHDVEILIVDDQYGIRILLNEVFQKEGYRTLLASSGLQALEMVNERDPKLVLLDMKIPGMNGLETLRRIKQAKPEVKVIIMTAYGDQDIIRNVIAGGAIAHFSKPFDLQELTALVKREVPPEIKLDKKKN
ncbi:response regulator [Sporolactobacillus putidus]|uniref:Sporulation initiation phosphotransferase F n=1 Tax=Sporolactobacillus putidus TaxID=492735 RepID=A0A917S193_9BACL|nr:response regulator [Sporolactobacillus putidus]GGL50191.1 sporulation initiation phosphotransferase F [Sporolactobacillus putidus]